jgi:glycosyltransferase involved in cell wall biosynthesis
VGVSIIVPAFNAERFLAATLKSVQSQTVGDWELIIVNDGSTDQTGTIAETFAHLDNRIRVVHQANAGISEARNRGFAEARANYEYCMFLDSDDLLEPDALEVLLQALAKDQNAAGAHGIGRYIDCEGRPISYHGAQISPRCRRCLHGWGLKVLPANAPTTFAVMACYPVVAASGLVMRRSAKEAAGDFDPSQKLLEDWHMWLRVSRIAHLSFVNRFIFSYRKHEGNISNLTESIQEALFEVRKKMYLSPDLNEREKRIILLGYRYWKLSEAKNHALCVGGKLLQGKLIKAMEELRGATKHILSSIMPARFIFR